MTSSYLFMYNLLNYNNLFCLHVHSVCASFLFGYRRATDLFVDPVVNFTFI